MSEEKRIRINQATRELNVSQDTILDFLKQNGFDVPEKTDTAKVLNYKITPEQYSLLSRKFQGSKADKKEAGSISIGHSQGGNFVIDSNTVRKRTDKEDFDDDFVIEPRSKEKEVAPTKPKFEPTNPVQPQPVVKPVAQTQFAPKDSNLNKSVENKTVAPAADIANKPIDEPKVVAPIEKVAVAEPVKTEDVAKSEKSVVEIKPEVVVAEATKRETPIEVEEKTPVKATVATEEPKANVVTDTNNVAKPEEIPTKSEPEKAQQAPTTGLVVKGKIDLSVNDPRKHDQNNKKKRHQEQQQNRNSQNHNQGQNKDYQGKPKDPQRDKPFVKPAQPEVVAPNPLVEQTPIKPDQTPTVPTLPEVKQPEIIAQSEESVKVNPDQLKGLTILGKIDLPSARPSGKKPQTGGGKPGQPGQNNSDDSKKRKRKRIKTLKATPGQPGDATPRTEGQGQGHQNQGLGTSDRSTRPQHGGGQQSGDNRNRGDNRGHQNNQNNQNNQSGGGYQGQHPRGDRPARPGDNRQGPRPDRPTDNRPRTDAAPGSAPKVSLSTPVAATNPAKGNNDRGGKKKKSGKKDIFSDKDVSSQIKATMARMSGGKATNRSKYKKEKRQERAQQRENDLMSADGKLLKVTEFISAADLASMMDVSVSELISSFMSAGLFISINQRLDAEKITFIVDEFGYEVEFINPEQEQDIMATEEVDAPENLKPRAPIVTIMGHVDHGKTTLLDYIRKAKVAEGEAGGITQHIGAYAVTTQSGREITFLDTPGHEAFTAMRARGAQITDVVIIVVAADDSVMPQTDEAINHAKDAGVPIVFAINKVDKESAQPDKIREQLAQRNMLVEEWGGKYQSQEISAKKGTGIDELLEKVLLEADILELKANPDKAAVGTVVEAMLDKGKGYVATLLVQSGTLKVGDILLAGSHYGRVKAMYNHTGAKLDIAGPAAPVQILGLDGAPQAGDRFKVMETDREAREIAQRRRQIMREQSMNARKHITLEEIGRRLAVGNFQTLNIIVKGDVDGSVEALGDSLLKLSTDEIQVSIIHKGVGQISEGDVLLASASDAIIVGFQVRPSVAARKLAESEEIQIKLYSIIYDAINDVKDAMEGLLAPKEEEVITSMVEIRQIFKVSKIGNIAGCMVIEGTIKQNSNIRLVRDGIVIFTGYLESLKREQDDAREVRAGLECGLKIKNFNDIRQGDVVESFEIKQTKRTI